ncbi:hypothetical protein B0J13DRAFT_525755 [Dactylonectria estremocensis]|uniref:Uncharacterized protein n=1 Tax=Dactylonectria estremocensis TaxID=1079267 RepID=A0A9P9J2Y9_9HYPO|nr:hypothetical protein B0J13DRAFT_525755 [Dactylonectria estremocensis]
MVSRRCICRPDINYFASPAAASYGDADLVSLKLDGCQCQYDHEAFTAWSWSESPYQIVGGVQRMPCTASQVCGCSGFNTSRSPGQGQGARGIASSRQLQSMKANLCPGGGASDSVTTRGHRLRSLLTSPHLILPAHGGTDAVLTPPTDDNSLSVLALQALESRLFRVGTCVSSRSRGRGDSGMDNHIYVGTGSAELSLVQARPPDPLLRTLSCLQRTEEAIALDNHGGVDLLSPAASWRRQPLFGAFRSQLKQSKMHLDADW